MDDAVRALLALRDIDEKMARLSKKLEDKPARLKAHKREVETAERELETVREQVKKLQTIVDRRNVELQTAEGAIEKLSEQLNGLKTNEDYQAMQRQIEAKQGGVREIEDRILEGMEVVEKAKTDLPRREEKLKAEQGRLEAEEKKVDAELTSVKAELESLKAEFEEKSSAVDQEALELYLALRKTRGHTAFVEVTAAGICLGCHTKVTSNVLNTAMAGRLTTCNACHRLIYFSA